MIASTSQSNVYKHFKLISSVLGLLVISCLLTPTFNLKLGQYMETPGTRTQTGSLSLATSDRVATIVDARARATTNQKALGIAGAEVRNDYIQNQGGVVAVADAQNNEKLVDARAHQENIAMRREYQERDALVDHTASTSYTTGITKRTDLNDEVRTYGTAQFEIGHDKSLTNSQQVVNDRSVQASTIQSQTGQPNQLTQTISKDITITIDSNNEKLIIEKLIHRDDRVIIVTAAKYLKRSLHSTEINEIQQLIYGQCNCKKIKDYVIELLAEAN